MSAVATDHLVGLGDHPGLRLVTVTGPEGAPRRAGVVGVAIPPRSPFRGRRVSPGMAASSGAFAVRAIQCRGEAIAQETRLEAGDTLLPPGTGAALDRHRRTAGVLLVACPVASRLGISIAATTKIVLPIAALTATGRGIPALPVPMALSVARRRPSSRRSPCRSPCR